MTHTRDATQKSAVDGSVPKRALVLETDLQVGKLLPYLFNMCGYTAKTFYKEEDALAEIRKSYVQQLPYDLMFLDIGCIHPSRDEHVSRRIAETCGRSISMKTQFNGETIALTLAESHPELPVILAVRDTRGYRALIKEHNISNLRLLHKPFMAKEFFEALPRVGV